MAETAKPAPKPEPAKTDVKPILAGRAQEGEVEQGTLTNNSPRGVGEPPADLVAEEPGAAALQGHVRDLIDDETKKGYRGVNTDPTPDYNYTVAGVNEGAPTPETVVFTPKGK